LLNADANNESSDSIYVLYGMLCIYKNDDTFVLCWFVLGHNEDVT